MEDDGKRKYLNWLLQDLKRVQQDKDCFVLPLHIATMVGSLGVRKGAWTEEEDNLLRKCVGIYGEGKWHQVPLRAGLNRCRKSCRLRWLNYLKPNIKRGEFAADEVDLMLRLHKLLGNRWSLIAARLPGRTSNDVKNYWNTHIQKKVVSNDKKKFSHETSEIVRPIVIRPRPRIFSRNSPCLREKVTLREDVRIKDNMNKLSPAVQMQVLENDNNWWDSILEDREDNGGDTGYAHELKGDEPIANQFWVEETSPPMEMSDPNVDRGRNHWSDVSFEADDIWNILSAI